MIRETAKFAAYASGALGTYHRLRNAGTLTVLMFHRVLPAAECQASGADTLWTISADFFEKILSFARHHYDLVGLDDVLASRQHRSPLPRRALLVTFDDGWRDNLDCALPILRRLHTPATLFAATDAIDEGRACWWQEVVLWALRSGRKKPADLLREAEFAKDDRHAGVGPELHLLLSYNGLEAGRREALLRPLAGELEQLHPRAHMVDPAGLHELAAAGFEVAVHGAAHLPLTELADPASDLAKARAFIALHTGEDGSSCLSFPHGRYDKRVVAAARQLGFNLLFTSDPIINRCADGWLESDLIGRIPVFSKAIASPTGRFSEPDLATWLFVRPRQALACDNGAS